MPFKLFKYNLVYFILVLFTSTCVNAYIPELFEGADKGIEEIAQSKGMNAPLYLMPSQRFMMMQALKNNRFRGNVGLMNKGLGLPFSIQGLDASDVGIFPQDARSALLQCLFPSPDGVILLANQAASDILSAIKPGTMGTILRRVQIYASTQPSCRDEQAFKVSIYSLILKLPTQETPENFRQLHQEHGAFLQHDLDIGLSTGVRDLIDSRYESYLEEGRITETENTHSGSKLRAIDELWATTRGETLTSVFKDMTGEFPTYEELNTLEEYAQEVGILKKLKQYEKLSDTDKACQSSLQEKHKVRLSFEERRPQFRALGFVEALTRAIHEQESVNEASFIYPDHMVEQTLMTYFWLKALKIDDVADFYGAFFDMPSSHIKPLFSKAFDRDGYFALKEKIQGNQIPTLTSEILSAAARGFDMYENPWPLLPQFQKAHYTPKSDRKSRLKGNSFPDCVETSVRDAVYIHAQTKRGEFYESDLSLLKLTPETTTALEQDPILRFSQEAHDRWGSYIAEIPGVLYNKPGKQKERKDGKYELHPGWFNALRVWAHLLGDRGKGLLDLLNSENTDGAETPEAHQSSPSSNDDDDDTSLQADQGAQPPLEKLNKGFEILRSLLSRDNHKVEIAFEGDEPEWKKKFTDFTAKIKVSINGTKIYNWTQDSDHSAITYEPMTLNDWRQNLTSPISATVGVLEQPFLPTKSLALMDDDLVRQRFWTLDFSNRDVLLELFEISLKKTGTIWEQVQRIILKHVKALEDASTEELFANKIVKAIMWDKPLSSERVEAIFRTCPSLLGLFDAADDLPRLESGALATTPIKVYFQVFHVFYNKGYKNIMALALELMERVVVQQNDVEIINKLGDFKKLKILDIEFWNRETLLNIIHKLPEGKTRAINFSTAPATAAEGVEVMKALLAKFPTIQVAIPIEGKEHLKELETFLKSLEEKEGDQFLLKEGYGFKAS